jgi:hypothetical protein
MNSVLLPTYNFEVCMTERILIFTWSIFSETLQLNNVKWLFLFIYLSHLRLIKQRSLSCCDVMFMHFGVVALWLKYQMTKPAQSSPGWRLTDQHISEVTLKVMWHMMLSCRWLTALSDATSRNLGWRFGGMYSIYFLDRRVFFFPEHGGSKFLRNTCKHLLDYMASYSRRH